LLFVIHRVIEVGLGKTLQEATKNGLGKRILSLGRPVRMIEEGCDAGLIAGEVTDDAVVARPAGQIHRCLAVRSVTDQKPSAVEKPVDFKAWPWLALSSEQFGGARTIRLSSPKRASQTLNVAPILLTVSATSLRTAALAGLGVVWLPLWLIKRRSTAPRIQIGRRSRNSVYPRRPSPG
jgi:DNA-binding transcriptional LysR family regulator